jgi:hypothetical protein
MEVPFKEGSLPALPSEVALRVQILIPCNSFKTGTAGIKAYNPRR